MKMICDKDLSNVTGGTGTHKGTKIGFTIAAAIGSIPYAFIISYAPVVLLSGIAEVGLKFMGGDTANVAVGVDLSKKYKNNHIY